MFAGSLGDVVVGVLLVTPLVLDVLVTSLGLLLQGLVRDDAQTAALRN